MIETEPQRIPSARLSQLAAATVFFWALSAAGACLDTTTAWSPQAAAPSLAAPTPERPDTDKKAGARVLTPRDAALYQAAFAAQETGDKALADAALGQITDKRLAGHVLADRYARAGMSLAEAKQWLAAYADLPEAETLYNRARHLSGFATVAVARPGTTMTQAADDNFMTNFGFRAADSGGGSPRQLKIIAQIDAALRNGDPLIARALLMTERQRGDLAPAAANDAAARIAAAFFSAGASERARPLAHSAATQGVPLGLWIDGLSAWQEKDYDNATRSFASLAQAPGLTAWDRAAAAFWAYRGARRIHDKAQARHWLEEAAKYPRSFYGYMAASLNGTPPGTWQTPSFGDENIAVLARYPAGWRALALIQVGRTDLAESELRHFNMAGHRDAQTAALALAESAHMPALALQLSGTVTNDDGQLYQAASYPLPPWQPADGFTVDRALLFALMKRESHFDPEAVSSRGACGLMQIMPATARAITRDPTDSGVCSARLFDPATNMALGQKYVRVLAQKPMIGDNLLLLLAAYNGGPGHLSHWLDNDARSDPLLFMESLPARETHDYVQQVLLHYWMYRSRLAEPETSVAQLARGQWPRYALNDNQPAGARSANTAPFLKLASAAGGR